MPARIQFLNPFCVYISIYSMFYVLQLSIAFHKETSHLIWRADQMTGFYIKYTLG